MTYVAAETYPSSLFAATVTSSSLATDRSEFHEEKPLHMHVCYVQRLRRILTKLTWRSN